MPGNNTIASLPKDQSFKVYLLEAINEMSHEKN